MEAQKHAENNNITVFFCHNYEINFNNYIVHFIIIILERGMPQ